MQYLQILLQPLILFKEEIQARFDKEVDLCGEGNDVDRSYVPAVGRPHTQG